MDKAQLLYNFWSGFGLPAYDENTVPSGSTMPYITYDTVTDSFDNVVQLHANLWYRSSSWATISQKANEISGYIGQGGKVFPIKNGYAWIVRGNPFSQRLSEEGDDMIRRIYLIIQAEFLTVD